MKTIETGIEAIDRMVGGLPIERITEVTFADPYLVSRFLEKLPSPHVLKDPSFKDATRAILESHPLLVFNNLSVDQHGGVSQFIMQLATWLGRPGRGTALVVFSKEGTTHLALKYFSYLRLALSTEGAGLKLRYVKNAVNGRMGHSIAMSADFKTIEPWADLS